MNGFIAATHGVCPDCAEGGGANTHVPGGCGATPKAVPTGASRPSPKRLTINCGRTGGDEFAVILELTDEQGAHEVIRRLDHALDGIHHASAGLATWDRHEDTDTLVARADTAMYRNKKDLAAATR